MKIYDREAEKMKILVDKYTNNCKNIAVVDVGWTGSNPMGIKNFIERKYKTDCSVKCLIAGSRGTSADNINEIQSEYMIPYMFAKNYNRINYDTHFNTNKNLNCVFFELMSQTTTPTFKGVSEEYELLFEIAEVENYDIADSISKGIKDFALLYTNKFKKYPHLLNISGYDAYLPFRMIIRDLKFIREYFGEFSYSRNVCSDNDNQINETIREIMIKSKV